MLTSTLRGLLAHKLRLALTTTSIALGVAFLAGTLILGDTMTVAFDRLLGSVSAGTDAVVRRQAAYEQTSGISLARAPLPAAVLDDVAAVPGVAAAEGAVSGYALLTDRAGRAVAPDGGAATLGHSLPRDAALRGDVVLRSGRAPNGPGEVAVDASSAAGHDIGLGARITILFRGPAETFTVVGVVGYGDEDDLGGTSAAYFDLATAQRVLGTPGTVDQIVVRAADGVGDAELARRIGAVVPAGAEAVTGETVARESSAAVNADHRLLDVMFLIFAGIALFVGSFIIWNTFSMLVAQRSREIALLRAVGATRRQIRRNLLLEAALLGLAASVIGLAAGAGVAAGLRALLRAVGFGLPSTSIQVLPRTVVLSLLVGVVVTVAAAYVPARRATRVLPVEALREATPGARPSSRRRAVAGAVLAIGGLAAILHGLSGADGPVLPEVLAGIAGVLLGAITLAPQAAGPLASVIGAPLRWRGVEGDLARANAMRNPRRTAATATALMIGLTLVVGMGVLAASLKTSFGGILHDATTADLYVSPASFQAGGFSPDVARIVADVPGVDVVSPTSYGTARFAGAPAAFGSVDPATVERVLDLGVASGSVRDLGTDGILLRTTAAAAHGWTVGDTVPVEFATTGRKVFTVRGTYATNTGFVESDYIIGRAAHDAADGERLDGSALVLVADGADRGAVRQRVGAALAAHPDAKVLDRDGYEQEINGTLDQLLAFVSVLLLLAIVIALLGIVNTLALSVFERTREIGLLRAVGMTRSQVRSTVRWESVVIALIGAGTGAGLGIGLGTALALALEAEGVTRVAVPVPQIVAYVAAAALAGVLAAVGPARSAAGVDVLKAVSVA